MGSGESKSPAQDIIDFLTPLRNQIANYADIIRVKWTENREAIIDSVKTTVKESAADVAGVLDMIVIPLLNWAQGESGAAIENLIGAQKGWQASLVKKILTATVPVLINLALIANTKIVEKLKSGAGEPVDLGNGLKLSKETIDLIRADAAKFKEWFLSAKDSVLVAAKIVLKESSGFLEEVFNEHIINVIDIVAGAQKMLGAAVAPEFMLIINICVELSATMYRAASRAIGTGFGALKKLGGMQSHHMSYLGAYGVSGGSESANIALDTIKSYGESVNSKTKERLINDIISALSSLGFSAEEKSGDKMALVKAIVGKIPEPEKMGTVKKGQESACVKIARVVNDKIGREVIDVSLEPAIICSHVTEFLYSLATSMHAEFLFVHKNVQTCLQNMLVLRDSLEETFNVLLGKVAADKSLELKGDIEVVKDLHKMILAELDRQIQMLRNFLNVTLNPADTQLSALIKSSKDMHGYIEKLSAKPGTSDFARVISNVLKGLGTTANFALLVERALKNIGLNMKEYVESKNLRDLITKINENLLTKKLNDDELHEYLQSAKLVYENFYRKDDIEKMYKGSYDNIDSSAIGGAEYEDSKLDKRISDRKKVKNLILRAFHDNLSVAYESLMVSIDNMAAKIGSEIPLSDQLDGLRGALAKVSIELLTNKNIYYALTGFYRDALSVSKREIVLSELKMVQSYLATLVEMSLYAKSAVYFKEIQRSIDMIVGLIEKYTSEITARFNQGAIGGAEDDDDAFGSSCEFLGEKTGSGFYGAYEGGAKDDFAVLPQNIIRTTKKLSESLRKFDHNYQVAQIKDNMKRTAVELKHYAENYEKMRAKSIADAREQITKDHEDFMKGLRKYPRSITEKSEFPAAYLNNDDNVKNYNAAEKFAEEKFEVRMRFWKTLEAVDAYLQHFTNNITVNSEEFNDIKKILDGVELISEWYNDSTGDNLTAAFDEMPHDVAATGGIIKANVSVINNTANQHYYQRVFDATTREEATIRAAGGDPTLAHILVGNPFIVTDPSEGYRSLERLRKALTSLGALKNLMSLFTYIGSKFGGVEFYKKIFMPPKQIYNNLQDYILYSAYEQGFIKSPNNVGGLTVAETHRLLSTYSTKINDASLTALLNEIPGILGVAWHALPAGAALDPFIEAAIPEKIYEMILAAVYADANLGVRLRANPGAVLRIKSLILGALGDGNQNLLESVNNASYMYLVNINLFSNSLHLQPRIVAATNFVDPDRSLNGDKPSFDIPIGVFYLDNPGLTVNPLLRFRQRYGIVMKGIASSSNLSYSLAGDMNSKKEDAMFALTIKALSAKVLTVLGLNTILNRPSGLHSLNNVRVIIGGSDTQVKSENTELYFRLPLLAQFYRELFSFDNNKNFAVYPDLKIRDHIVKISMVPDIDGVFGELVNIIFKKNLYVKNYAFSDDDIKSLINEINAIRGKLPEKSHREIMQMFVEEVNRRYGIVSKEQRDNYDAEFGFQYGYTDPEVLRGGDRYSFEAVADVPILPDEIEQDIDVPAPSDNYVKNTKLARGGEYKSAYGISNDQKILLYRFRCMVDNMFSQVGENNITFVHAIKEAEKKIKVAANEEDKVKIAAALMRGVNAYTRTDDIKYLMFHEIVVAGLNTLNGIYTHLASFRNIAAITDPQNYYQYIDELLAADTAEDITVTQERTKIRDILARKYPYFTIDETLINSILGEGRNSITNGGTGTLAREGIKMHAGMTHAVEKYADEFRRRPAVNATTDAAELGPIAVALSVIYISSDNGVVAPALTARRVANGLYGLIAKKTAESMRVKSEENDRIIETFRRFGIDREKTMKYLLEGIYDFSKDLQGLVNVRLEDGKFLINYGNLKAAVDEMFASVGAFIDYFRPYIDNDVMDRFVNKLKPGSFYWLQEQLLEKLIIGRPAQRNVNTPATEYMNLERITQKINDTFADLTKKWNVDGRGLARPVEVGVFVGTSVVSASNVATQYDQYDKVFAEMIFYDAAKAGSGLGIFDNARGGDVSTNNVVYGVANDPEVAVNLLPKLVDFQGHREPIEMLYFNGAAEKRVMDTRFIARWTHLYSWGDELAPNQSLMMMFNQLLAKYMKQVYDVTSQKVYAPCLNNFINGAMNQSIADPNHTWPDTYPTLHVVVDKQRLSNDESLMKRVKTLQPGMVRRYITGVFNTILASAPNQTFDPATYVLAVARAIIRRVIAHLRDYFVWLDATYVGAAALIGFRANANNENLLQYMLQWVDLIMEFGDVVAPAGAPARDGANAAAYGNSGNIANAPCARLGAYNGAGGAADLAHNTWTAAMFLAAVTNIVGNTDAYLDALFGAAAANSNQRNIDIVRTMVATPLTYNMVPSAPTYRAANEENKERMNQLLFLPLMITTDNVVPYTLDQLARELANVRNTSQVNGRVGNKYGEMFAALMPVNDYYNVAAIQIKYAKIKEFTITKKLEGDATGANDSFKYLVNYSEVYSMNSIQLNVAADIPAIEEANCFIRLVTENADPGVITDRSMFAFLGYSTDAGGTRGNNIPYNHVAAPVRGRDAGSNGNHLSARFFGCRCDPDPEKLLFTSLSVLLKNMMFSKNAAGGLQYVTDNLSDIPQFVKDRLRLACPMFKSMYQHLIFRAEYIKNILADKNIRVTRDFTMSAACRQQEPHRVVNSPFNNPWPMKALLTTTVTNTNEVKLYFNNLCDVLTRASNNIISCCDQVIRELADSPKYAETGFNSIKEYKSQNGYDPLMLPSNLFAINTWRGIDYPFHVSGETKFKLLYGTRGIYGSIAAAVDQDGLPGFWNLYNDFNGVVESKQHLPKEKCNQFLNTYLKLNKYIFEKTRYKGLFKGQGAFNSHVAAVVAGVVGGTFGSLRVRANPALLTAATAVAIANKGPVGLGVHLNNVVYGTTVKPKILLNLIENINKEKSVKQIVAVLKPEETNSADLMPVLNIIDLNILPINVHALMRDVPLANIYNYAYTFDRIVVDTFVKDTAAKKDIMNKLCEGNYNGVTVGADSAINLFIQMMVNPYMDFSVGGHYRDGISTYENIYKQIIAGKDGLNMGRPKFISDQIFEKATFGTLYTENEIRPNGIGELKHDKIVHLLSHSLDIVLQILAPLKSSAPGLWSEALHNIELSAIRNTWKLIAPVIINYKLQGNMGKVTDIRKIINEYTALLFNNAGLPAGAQDPNLTLVYGDLHVVYETAAGAVPNTEDLVLMFVLNIISYITAVSIDLITLGLLGNINFPGDVYKAIEYVVITTLAAISNDAGFAAARNNMGLDGGGAELVNAGGAQITGAGGVTALPIAGQNAATMFGYYFGTNLLYNATLVPGGAAAEHPLTFIPIAQIDPIGPVIFNYAKAIFTNFYNGAPALPVVFDNSSHINAIREATFRLINPIKSAILSADITDESLTSLLVGTDIIYGDNGKLNKISFNKVPDIMIRLYGIGKLRNDTHLIRNLIFVTNAVRVLRQRMNSNLFDTDDETVKSFASSANTLTEFVGNSIYKRKTKYNPSAEFGERF